MGRMYSIQLAAAAKTTAFDVVEIAPAANKPIVIHSVHLGQTTELGDAQEEQLEWSIRRGGTGMASGSGGATPTPIALNPGDPACSATVEAGNTTVATFTSGVVVHDDAFNVRTGLLYVPTPECRAYAHNGNGGIVVRVEGTPADSITFVGTVVIEELG